MTDDRGTPGDGDGTQLESRTEALLRTVEGLGGAGEHRREALTERAEERGLGRPEAEEAYDIATEVGLEPAYGMALVLEGVSVRLLDGPRPGVEASEPNEPEWVDAPPSPEAAERERRLRQTFRRLRSRLQDAPSPADGVRSFLGQPDLERHEY